MEARVLNVGVMEARVLNVSVIEAPVLNVGVVGSDLIHKRLVIDHQSPQTHYARKAALQRCSYYDVTDTSAVA